MNEPIRLRENGLGLGLSWRHKYDALVGNFHIDCQVITVLR